MSKCVEISVCVRAKCFSCVLFATLWTTAHQAPLSKGFSRQEYWRGLPYPPPGNLPNLRIEPPSPALQTNSLPLSHQGSPSLPLLIPSSQSFSPSFLSPLAITSLFSVSVSLFLLHRYINLCPILHSTCK